MRQGTGTNRPKTYTQPKPATTNPQQIKQLHPTTKHTPPQQVNKVTAEIATGKRPDPSRTRKLSLPAPMILPNPGGKVGHRRTLFKTFAPQFCWGAKAFSRELFSVEQSRRDRVPALLQREQCALAVQSTAVSGEVAVRADHPVARHDDADWVVAVGQSHRAGR